MADKNYPDRVIPRHSKQTRFTHGVVAIACIWLAISGLFVFVPALANAFPGVSQAMRVSHRIVGAIFILVPIISAITAPQGFKAFCKKYFKKWTPEDFEFMKKFVPYMLGPKKVHMPDQDEVKSGQRFADGMLWVAGAQLDGMTCMQLFANRLRSRRQILRAHRASGFDSIVSMRRKR